MLDFLAQNRLEAVRVELSDNDNDDDDDAVSDHPSHAHERRRDDAATAALDPTRVDRTSTSSSSTSSNSDSESVCASGLSDLANVREMLEFMAQNRLENVRLAVPTAHETSSSDHEQEPAHRAATCARRDSAPGSDTTQAPKQTERPTKKRARAAAERERDRTFAKRVYYQRLDTLQDLQRQVERLEADAAAALAQYHDTRASGRGEEQQQPPLSGVADARERRIEHGSARDRFVALLEERRALEAEQTALQTQLAAVAQCAQHVSQLAAAELRSNARTQREWTERSAEPPRGAEYRPVTLEYCAEVTDRAYKRVCELRARSPSSFTWGAELFGWKDFRTVEASCITYSLEKIFLFQHYERMAQQYWDLATAEQSSERLYSPSLKVRFHILQRVDANNLVIYRTIDRPAELGPNGLEQRMRTFVLTSRVALSDGRGCVILTCAIDPARVLASATAPPKGRTRLEPVREEMWMDNLKWLICEPMGESAQHSKLVFGGVLDGVATANPSQWILEELMIGIRYERGGSGPFNILCD